MNRMTDPTATAPNMDQLVNGCFEFVRAALVPGADEQTCHRARQAWRFLGSLLEAPAVEAAPVNLEIPPYQPQQPRSFAEYVAHLVSNPAELAQMLGVPPAMLPALAPMLRNVMVRPQQPAYAGGPR
jgi:hypothetical protein